MAIEKLFKCHLPFCKYIFVQGKEANFLNHKFSTGVQSEIDELTREVQLGHPHIYIDALEPEFDTAIVDPMAALEAKIRAKIAAEDLALRGGDTGESNSESGKLSGIATSATVSSMAAGGAGSARTINLPKA